MSAACLRGIEREGVERGQVLAKPGSITPHTKFKAEAYILTKEEGGRHTPFFANYRPQFYFRTTDVTGVVQLPGRHRDGDAGRQHRHDGRADRADRHGGEACVSPSARAAAPSAPAWWRQDHRVRERPVGAPSKRRALRLRPSRCKARISESGSKPSTIASSMRRPRRSSTPRSARAREVRGTHSAADAHREVHREPLAAYRQEEPRAVRDAHA